MTTLAVPVMDHTATAPHARPPGMPFLLISGMLAFVYPPIARSWPRASVWRAIPIAVFNTLCGGLWTVFMIVAAYVWIDRNQYVGRALTRPQLSLWELQTYRQEAAHVRDIFLSEWAHANTFDRISPIAAGLLFLLGAFLLPFFVILPFGTRPGPNKPVTRHVARTVLLGSGMIHWWGAAFVGTFLAYAAKNVTAVLSDNYAGVISPLLLVFTLLTVWTLVVLILAVRREYRTPADFPQPHDPWCDDCGYILTGIDPAGRCPECGRLISDSLGPNSRLPTPWESHPRFTRVGVVAAQLADIYRHPRRLFFSMPTLTGQGPAQRWLVASIVVLFVLALPIVPAIYLSFGAEWNFALVAGSLAMALTWAVFGLMMVGIETAGVATFSRLRGQVVYLATSAKVTAYSAILMVPWIILGGTQLVVFTYLASQHPNGIQRLFHVGMRGEQVVLALSLAAAHIGGLLWYELTVYRGIRAIQYANK